MWYMMHEARQIFNFAAWAVSAASGGYHGDGSRYTAKSLFAIQGTLDMHDPDSFSILRYLNEKRRPEHFLKPRLL